MKKINLEESLLHFNPVLARDWHKEKNNGLLPSDVKPKSNKKVWWQCPKNELHEWDAVISSRHLGRGCPYCSGQKPHITNCLAILNPPLAMEWHPTLNEDLTPYDYTFKSKKKVWWLCPKDMSHEWAAQVSNRANGDGCPYCAGKKVNNSNSLATLIPSLAEEWHPTLNEDLSPHSVTPGSNKKVWWRCKRDHNHEWRATIDNRTKGKNCPECKKELKTSFPEQALYYYIKQVFPDSLNRYIFTAKGKKEVEVDIYIPSLNFAIEYDGVMHDDLGRDLIKNKILLDEKVKLIRVRVPEIPKMINENIVIFIHDVNDKNSLIYCLTKIGIYLNSSYPLENEKKKLLNQWNLIDIEVDRFKIYEQYICSLKENSIANLRPDLLEEWDYEQNNGLNPEFVSVGSNKVVHWKCKKNDHTWKAMINNRNNGTDCPYCSNKKIDSDGSNSLALRYPELSKEWHPNLNQDLTPFQVLFGSHKRVWWLCKKDSSHVWDATIDSRTQGKRNCPYCSGKRVNNSNSLASLNPVLAKEWHPTLNGELTPNDITPSSNKQVWWLCNKNSNHSWKAKPNDRNGKSKTGCPYCSGKLVDIHNCLKTTHPELAEEWHPTKNGDLTPYEVSKGSHKKVWWMCKKNNSHEWEARIDSRSDVCKRC